MGRRGKEKGRGGGGERGGIRKADKRLAGLEQCLESINFNKCQPLTFLKEHNVNITNFDETHILI